MASVVKDHESREAATPVPMPCSQPPRKVFISFVTPFLYGMERAVIELFDALRPQVEPYFPSKRIFERHPPIIGEMIGRGFSIELLPDRTDWERLGKPRSVKHFFQMLVATVRTNFALLKGVRGKDVLYVPGISAASGSLLAAIYCRLTGRRVIHHFHDLGTSNRLFPLWIALVTDCVHNTEFGFQSITNKLTAVTKKRNFIVPYVMEVDECMPDGEACRELAGQRNLFFVGQISRHKGVDLLVQAFIAVAAKHLDVMLHLIGDGHSDFRSALENEIRAAGLRDRVRFWGFRGDATRLLRFAYIYVHTTPPSRCHESFGRSVVEAMAQRVPIVCFRSGALQEIVLHERTGLFSDESPQLLGEAMNRLLQDPELRNSCASGARARFESFYSRDAVLGRWRTVFETSQ